MAFFYPLVSDFALLQTNPFQIQNVIHIPKDHYMPKLFFFLVLLLALGCKKDRVSLRYEQEVVGWYEWVHSSTYDGTMKAESQETIQEKYAFVIKKNGNVIVRQDKTKINKGYIASYSENNIYHSIDVRFKSDLTGKVDNLIEGKLIVKNYPIRNSFNTFIKTR